MELVMGDGYIPQTVDSPGISRARGWVGIPELSLQEGTAGVIEAAGRSCGRALATERVGVAASLQLGRGSRHQRGSRQGQHRRARESHSWTKIEVVFNEDLQWKEN